MRLLALAQAWLERGGEAVLVSAECPDVLVQRFEKCGATSLRLEMIAAENIGSSTDLAETCRVIGNSSETSNWLAVDGYRFTTEYQDGLSERGIPTLWLDDSGGCERYRARWILNQNGQANADLYRNRGDDTELLLGSKFTLLRSEFTRYCDEPRRYPERVGRLIISIGGADENNVTARVLDVLEELADGLEIVVVLGPLNAHRTALVRQIEASKLKVELLQDVSRMADVLASCDLGIIAPGTTLQETQFLGLPCLLVVVADNQINGAKFAEENGLAIQADLNDLKAQIIRLLHDAELRRSLGEAGRSFIDGRGRDRVVAAMLGEHYAS